MYAVRYQINQQFIITEGSDGDDESQQRAQILIQQLYNRAEPNHQTLTAAATANVIPSVAARNQRRQQAKAMMLRVM